ncbi:MAG: 50S ribosomal protein L11 methyltransferase [Acidimicrobiales bacterium]
MEELPGRLRAAFADPEAADRARDALAPDAAIDRFDDTHGLDAARDLLTVEYAGRFAVHPPWLDPPAGHQPIAIDPGHAFGSGSHPSTRLALELLGEESPSPLAVFDIGCGTGVLAIAAAVLGAHVIAVDIDPAAIAATRANADRNRVADRVDVIAGSADLAVAPVDLVTVNVTIDIHERIAPTLPTAHRRLVVAGILGEEQLHRCATAYGAAIERSLAQEGWMAAVLTRP